MNLQTKAHGAPGLNQDLLRTGGERPEGKGTQGQTGEPSIPRGMPTNTPDLINVPGSLS